MLNGMTFSHHMQYRDDPLSGQNEMDLQPGMIEQSQAKSEPELF